MKIDLFENKYGSSKVSKILFIDIICFLLVASVTLGLCYSYFSDTSEISGSATTAVVDVEYQYNAGSGYVASNDIYVIINDTGAPQKLNTVQLTPGDKITIVGQVYNKSDVSVYVLAKLEIDTVQNGVAKTEEAWFNIGYNDPNNEAGEGINHSNSALNEEDYVELKTAVKTGEYGTYNIYQAGAGRLGSKKSKLLELPYVFDGDKYVNGDEISNVRLTIHVHQVEHLRTASDFYLYSQFEDENKQINGYSTESVYASHYMANNQLDANE